MLIRSRVTLIQAAVAAGMLVAVIAVLSRTVSAVLTSKDEELYREKLASVAARVSEAHATLEKTGLADVEAYVQGAQKAVLEELARGYASGGDEVRLVVLDRSGAVVLHRSLPAGSRDLAGSEWVAAMRASPEVGAAALEDGGRRWWVPYARFAPWDWSLGYAVREDVRTAAVDRLLRSLLAIGAVSMAV